MLGTAIVGHVIRYRQARLALALMAGLVLAITSLANQASAAEIVVTSINDALADGDAVCSLREAILNANNNNQAASDDCAAGEAAPVVDVIKFAIIDGGAVKTISVDPSGLPLIDETVTIDGYTQPGAKANTLAVGTDAVILVELDGGGAFVLDGLIVNAPNVTIRGLAIHHFDDSGRAGIYVTSAASGARITGNYVGTNAAGTSAPTSNDDGVFVEGSGVIIGGTTPGERNVISGNHNSGVSVCFCVSATIIGNYIGTNASGTAALANSIGIDISDAAGTIVGGTTPGARNVISGNFAVGVLVGPTPFGTGALIQGNAIGTAANGTGPLPNGVGIFVQDATDVTIGGIEAGAGNVIANNTVVGVAVAGAGQAKILGNSIHSNSDIGIDLDLDGVTPNDVGDGDSGANNLQNFPEILAASSTASVSHIAVKLESAASQTYTVELFSNPGCDSSGYGEGQTFIGRAQLQTSGSQTATALINGSPATIGSRITATATDAAGNTSEFSQCSVPATVVLSPAVTVAPSGGSTSTVEGGATDTFTVVLGSQPTDPVSISLTSSVPGLASFAPAATLTFTPANWSTPQVVTVTSVDDQVSNGPTYTIAFNAASTDPFYNGIAIAALTATHTDNDPLSSLSVADVSAVEPTSGSGPLTFTVTMAPANGSSITVNYAVVNGTATGGSSCTTGVDYLTTSGTLTFAPLETNKTVPVTLCADNVAEGPETITIALTNAATGATIGRATATGTITEGTGLSVSIGDVAVREGNIGTTAATFPVTLNLASPQVVTVQYATSDGTARAPQDYLAVSGILTFQPGETSKSVTVDVVGETATELDETFSVTLTNPTGGAALARAQATGTIQNDDGGPTVSIGDVVFPEGNTKASIAVFPVTLSGAMPRPVTVEYATSDGTAIVGNDYRAATGSVTFQPGETSKSIVIPVIGDLYNESDETFMVMLSNPTLVAIGRAQATGTIQNDDPLLPCTPQPAVQLRQVVANGALRATLSTSAKNTQEPNLLHEIRLGALQNARVTLNGQALTSNQTVTLPANTLTIDLIVERVTPGQATTVPVTLVDSCGEWPTIVGGGTGAGF